MSIPKQCSFFFRVQSTKTVIYQNLLMIWRNKKKKNRFNKLIINTKLST